MNKQLLLVSGILAITLAGCGKSEDPGSTAGSKEATTASAPTMETSTMSKTEPMAQEADMVAVAETAAPESEDNGKAIYAKACFACHATGVANAPKLGDAAAWAPRIAQGEEVLIQTALKGKGAMPPKGGRMDFSDDDIAAAVIYMVNNSK